MKCPGQDTKYWKPGAIYDVMCPRCNHEVEFFKDDTSRKCANCGHRFVNPQMDFGCAAYCQFAEQCLGTLPDEVKHLKETSLKDGVAVEMKRHFKTDFKRIGHVVRVAEYAEKIGKDAAGNLAVIIISAYLHGIGTSDLDQMLKMNGFMAHHQKSADLARKILEKIGSGQQLADMVVDVILNCHQPGDKASLEMKIVHDAVRIAQYEVELASPTLPESTDDPTASLDGICLTDSGKRIMRQLLLKK